MFAIHSNLCDPRTLHRIELSERAAHWAALVHRFIGPNWEPFVPLLRPCLPILRPLPYSTQQTDPVDLGGRIVKAAAGLSDKNCNFQLIGDLWLHYLKAVCASPHETFSQKMLMQHRLWHSLCVSDLWWKTKDQGHHLVHASLSHRHEECDWSLLWHWWSRFVEWKDRSHRLATGRGNVRSFRWSEVWWHLLAEH